MRRPLLVVPTTQQEPEQAPVSNPRECPGFGEEQHLHELSPEGEGGRVKKPSEVAPGRREGRDMAFVWRAAHVQTHAQVQLIPRAPVPYLARPSRSAEWCY